MPGRRGSKGNPFKVGERVRLRGSEVVAEVAEVCSPEQNSPAMGERSYAPIRYSVKVGAIAFWFAARDLEAVDEDDAS
jgi:hypothetical protein